MGQRTPKEERGYFKALRDELSAYDVQERSKQIQNAIYQLEIYQKAAAILFYYAKDKEVQTREAILNALTLGKKVALPVCCSDASIKIYQVKDLDRDLRVGSFGVMEPKEEACEEFIIDEVDLVLVPGLAFDLRGGRLGWGKGYYDRFLMDASVIKAGLAYEIQVVKELELDHQDVLLDMLITDRQLRYFKD